jgi:hypothetical protein
MNIHPDTAAYAAYAAYDETLRTAPRARLIHEADRVRRANTRRAHPIRLLHLRWWRTGVEYNPDQAAPERRIPPPNAVRQPAAPSA